VLNQVVAILGCGNIGGALAQRIDGQCQGIRLFDSAFGKAADLRLHKAVECSSAVQTVKEADLVVVALKPSGILTLLKEISSQLKKNSIVVSVAAGVTTSDLNSALPEGQAVVRVMPNLAMAYGQGVTGIYSEKSDAAEKIEALFSLVGKTVIFKDESLIDVITGVAGSGPAFVARAINGLKLAAEQAGIDPSVSGEIAAQTALGAASILLQNNESPESLIKRVTTPGGTTEKGLEVLEERNFEQSMIDAVEVAIGRAREGMAVKEKNQ